jgi:hypothetical protein
MKKFKATIDSIIINKRREVVGVQVFDVEVFGEGKGDAIISALDVGQALARSANYTNGQRAIYFRVIDIVEIEESTSKE